MQRIAFKFVTYKILSIVLEQRRLNASALGLHNNGVQSSVRNRVSLLRFQEFGVAI